MRDNATVKEIVLSKEQLSELEMIKTSNRITPKGKEQAIKKVTGGICCICGDLPKYIVSYDATDYNKDNERQAATRIERYCDSCVKKIFQRAPVL